MKQATINERDDWTFMVPETIARWDAIHHWERERLASMEEHLKPGMTLFDVGSEHGWMTAVYGGFVGYENVVLCEPGPEMWQDIRKIWVANNFPEPKACWPGFIGAENSKPYSKMPAGWSGWPDWTDPDGPESPPMAYRYIGQHDAQVDCMTLSTLAAKLKVKVDAITCDVEGAEFLVMKGAQKVLETDRPLVWISVHPDLMQRDFGVEHVEEMFDWMDARGYKREYLTTDHEQHHLWRPVELS